MNILNSKAHMNNDRFVILKRLLILRAAVLGSFIIYAFAFTNHVSGVATLASLILASSVYSWFMWLRYINGRVLSDSTLTIQLIWDTIVILLFVLANGRSTNPFIYYLLVVVAISASILPEKIAWVFSASGIIAYSLLMHLDFNQHMAHMDSDFRSHLLGMWVNFVGSAVLISFFISRLANVLKARERALGLAREEILKNEQLIGIGTLAASTVHSFGTPLSTITMATGEISAIHKDRETSECTDMIKTQIERCKNTMSKLTMLASDKGSPNQDMALDVFVYELKEHFSLMNVKPMPTFKLKYFVEFPNVPGGILLLHAIINLIDNAIHAAKSCVSVNVEIINRSVQFSIEDDGTGIESEDLKQFGEAVFSSSNKGLGIGFLLANSTIESLKGHVSFENPDPMETNSLTRVVAEIPLANIQQTGDV